MSSSIRKQPDEEELSPLAQETQNVLQDMQQRMQQICDEFTAKLMKELNVMPKPFIEFPVELPTLPPTLPPAEQATKPVVAPQLFMEPIPPQPPQPPSEPSIPKVACVAKEHHIRHRVIERIGFRSNSSPRASCSAFVRLDLHPAATLLVFGSWTFIIIARTGQWDPSDHGSSIFRCGKTGWEQRAKLHPQSVGLIKKQSFLSELALVGFFSFEASASASASYLLGAFPPTSSTSTLHLHLMINMVTYKAICIHRTTPNNCAIVRLVVVNKRVIGETLLHSSWTKEERTHFEYTDADEGFYALLGSIDGACSMRMLIDRKESFGFRTVERVVILRAEGDVIPSPTFMILLSSKRIVE